MRFTHVEEVVLVRFFEGHQGTTLSLSEEERVQTHFVVRDNVKPKSPWHGHFQQGHEQATVSHVVGGHRQVLLGDFPEARVEVSLVLEVEVGRRRALNADHVRQVFRRVDAVRAWAQLEDELAFLFEVQACVVSAVVHDPHHANRRRREHRLGGAVGVGRLVVETHVSARHRRVEMAAGPTHALNGADKLPVHLRVVRVAKVQAVRDRRRHCTCAADVSGSFRHGNRGPDLGVRLHVARVAIDRQGQRLVCAPHRHHAGVGRPVGRAVDGPNHAVVLLPNPTLRRDVGEANHLVGDVHTFVE